MISRGPDDEGYCWDIGVGLGMRRLAVVDLVGGRQPISNEAGKLWVVFNGEIYNAPELRRQLEAEGHRFKTRSDTEVIVHLYQARGLRFADDMRGMWALAIHDTRLGRVVLSRDRLGIKPLFVHADGDRIVFASELRAFRAISGVLGANALQWDPAAAQAMLSWSYVPGARTIYHRVRSVEPGTHEIINSAGSVAKHRYWDLRVNENARAVRSMEEAVEVTESELKRAVREHLESDVAVGAFVSGGIDSGLVAAYASEGVSELCTFAVGFDEEAFDESAYAAEVAAAIGSKHVLMRLGVDEVYDELPKVLARSDSPFGDSSIIAASAVSRLAAKTHKVVLSGDGGDEVFAGYVKHSIISYRRRLRVFPRFAFRLADIPLRRLPQSRDHHASDFFRKARRALGALGASPAEGYASLTRIASLEETAALMLEPAHDAALQEWVRRAFAAAPGSDELAKTLAADMSIVLPNDMLTKVDQASMAHSLEARVPFLDHKLVEIGWSLPSRFKLGSGTGKLVLREIFRKRFGEKLASRPKRGFQVPVESWLAGPLQCAMDRFFEAKRLEQHCLLDPRCFDATARRSMLVQRPLLLWNAFCLAVWCEVSSGAVDEDELRHILGQKPRVVQFGARGASSAVS